MMSDQLAEAQKLMAPLNSASRPYPIGTRVALLDEVYSNADLAMAGDAQQHAPVVEISTRTRRAK